MSINVANLPTYTDAEMLTVYRWALVNGAAGTTRTVQGRSVTFPAANVMMDIIRELELRLAASGAGTNAFARVPDFVPQLRIPGMPR